MNDFDVGSATGSPVDRLDGEDLAAVHAASMHILAEVGIQLNDERARELVVDHGGEVQGNDVVTLPREVVERSLREAPSEFTLHARNPENDVVIGGENPIRAPGYGPAHVHTAAEGRRRATLADYERLAKLAQLEDVVTCAGYALCDPEDVDRGSKHLETFRRSLALTDKPVMGSTRGRERARECLEMAAIAMADPDLSRPRVLGLVNTVPPRSIDGGMLGGLLTYAERGQPLVVSSFTMAGASGPGRLAASMAQANAENLAAITLAQLENPGTPVVYGLPSSNIDARYGSLSIGSPESALFASFAGQMGRYYDVPSRGGGGLTDAKDVDFQAGFESTLLQSVGTFAGVDFVLNAAGVLASYSTVSPEKFVLDCETLEYLDRFGRGVDVDDIGLDRVAETDPAGHFLGAPDGDGEFYRPSVADKRAYGDWAEDGGRSAFEAAADRVDRLLEGYERPPLDEDIASDLAAYVDERV